MKRLYLFLFFLMTVCFGMMADDLPKDSKRDKMFKEVQEFKMKYLAQEMNLTEEQKPRFFELYSEMSRSREECHQPVKELEQKIRKNKDVSEEDYQNLTDARNKANLEYAEIESEYDEKFSTFLTPKQIYQMKEGEKNFRKKLEEMRRDKKREHKKKESK
ncbi:MAG: Spy/CpxP family protein refolding chaperone [Muribaculaceae bacterium]|nr:Spy/CpxP family protein refolding chaperone [Muribaculaceae bacterium]